MNHGAARRGSRSRVGPRRGAEGPAGPRGPPAPPPHPPDSRVPPLPRRAPADEELRKTERSRSRFFLRTRVNLSRESGAAPLHGFCSNPSAATQPGGFQGPGHGIARREGVVRHGELRVVPAGGGISGQRRSLPAVRPARRGGHAVSSRGTSQVRTDPVRQKT